MELYGQNLLVFFSGPVTQTSDLTKIHSRLEKSRQVENESLLEKATAKNSAKICEKVSGNMDFSASL